MTIFYSWQVSIEKDINRSCLKTAWSWPQAVTCAVYLESCSAASTQVYLLFYRQFCVKKYLVGGSHAGIISCLCLFQVYHLKYPLTDSTALFYWAIIHWHFTVPLHWAVIHLNHYHVVLGSHSLTPLPCCTAFTDITVPFYWAATHCSCLWVMAPKNSHIWGHNNHILEITV